MFELRGHSRFLLGCIVFGFGFRRRDVADGFEQSAIVEPIDPFERGVFDRFHRSPRPAPPDRLGFEEAVDAFGERVVVAVADAADGRLDARFGQAFAVFDRYWLPRSE